MKNNDTSRSKKEADKINKETGIRLQEMRECGAITQEKLAEMLDISNRQVAHIEAGERGLTVVNAIVLADEFGKTLDYIYRGKEVTEGLDPVCQLVSDTMASIQDDKDKKECYMKTIINLSHIIMKA